MPVLDPAIVVPAAIAFLLAGLVKGVIGLGLPTVAMGLLTIVMPPAAAANLLLMPTVVTNIWQLLPRATFLPLLRRMAGLLVGLFAGTLLSPLPTLGNSTVEAQVALGAVLAAYGIWGLFARRLPSPGRHEIWLSPLVGYATGAIVSATGIFVIPLVPYVQSLALDKDRLVQAMGIIFCGASLALAVGLAANGALLVAQVGTSIVYLLPALAGMWAGQVLRRRVSEQTFKRAFFVAAVLLGGYMVMAAA